MASKNTRQHTPQNATDKLKINETMSIAKPTPSIGGWIARKEPPTITDEPVMIYASELTGRDIGRFIAFVKRFGQDLESVKIIVAELRQIYMTGADGEGVVLNVGTGAEEEFVMHGEDQIFLYGDGVTKAPLGPLLQAVDNDLRPIS